MEFFKAVIVSLVLAALFVGLTIAYVDGKKTVQAYKNNQFSVMRQITGN